MSTTLKKEEVFELFDSMFSSKLLEERLVVEGRKREIAKKFRDVFSSQSVPKQFSSAKAIKMMHKLAEQDDGVIIVPNTNNRTMIDFYAYLCGNPPNPYQWAPIIGQYSSPHDFVLEVGITENSSGYLGCWALERKFVILKPFCAPHYFVNSKSVQYFRKTKNAVHMEAMTKSVPPYKAVGYEYRPKDDGPSIDELRRLLQKQGPTLVLLPLPLPCDQWSVRNINNLDIKVGNTSFVLYQSAEPTEAIYPEFATSLKEYLDCVFNRVVSLGCLVLSGGMRLCISTPMVQGLPAEVEKMLSNKLKWKCIRKCTVIEIGGAKHVWNRKPIVGVALTVWE